MEKNIKKNSDSQTLPTFSLILNRCADDAISEEQITRLLKPIVAMIRDDCSEPETVITFPGSLGQKSG